jgi:hypothetical protein
MLGKISVVQDDKKAVFVELFAPGKFRIGEIVNISKKKKTRSLKQNNFYWCFLSWCIHPAGGNLQEQGHFSVEGLHEDVKAWFKDKHGKDFGIEGKFSTTALDKDKFKQFFDIVNQELMVEFFGVDTSAFWREYEKYGTWIDYNSEDFKDYMDEQLPF